MDMKPQKPYSLALIYRMGERKRVWDGEESSCTIEFGDQICEV